MNKNLETTDKMRKLQKEMMDLALHIANVVHIDLDFSIDSIKQVEKILAQIHSQYEETKDEEGLHGIALEFAAYIITVIEKNIVVGKWERNSEEFGKDSFPYHMPNGQTIFPYAWCLKRIMEGKSEDVWSKFQALVVQS